MLESGVNAMALLTLENVCSKYCEPHPDIKMAQARLHTAIFGGGGEEY